MRFRLLASQENRLLSCQKKFLLRVRNWLLFLSSFLLLCCCQATECRLTQPNDSPQLLVFISFSMPAQSLKLWSEQAAKVNGKLLLRGFWQDSLQNTLSKAGAVFGEKPGAELLIDPEAFQQFNVQSVPAVVVTQAQSCIQEDCPRQRFDLVYGDSDLESALRLITVKGSEIGRDWANQLLQQYRGAHGF